MKTLLLHATAYERIGSQLGPSDGEVRVVVMTDDGSFSLAGKDQGIEPPQPHIAYANTDVFFSQSAANFMRTVLSSPNLDWVQSSAAGLENPVLTAVRNAARIYTSNHSNAEAIAEWVIWQGLDFFRNGSLHRSQAENGEWRRILSRELAGSNWLIFGYGSIGQAAGVRLNALGANVTGVRRTAGAAPGAHKVMCQDDAMVHLAESDVVLLALPLSAETESMADAAFFAAMREDALFMNVGRGGLVDETALLEALDAGQPAYAALDVASTEPLPPGSAMWRHPRIALTPHDSASTPGSIERADKTFLDNLSRYLNNVPLRNVVGRERAA